MSQLGHLLWWKIAEGVELDYDTLGELLKGTGVGGPARPLPVDVFRRVTGPDVKRFYTWEGGTVEVTLAPVDSRNEQMLQRHIVGTVKNSAGVVQSIKKMGDVAFYKPPRNQHSKARMRVVPGVALFPGFAQDFAHFVRSEYDKGLQGALNGQAVRRVVRACLADQKAVHLGGPYFIEHLRLGDTLRGLFERLGEDSFMHVVQLEDLPAHRELLRAWGWEA